MNKINRVIEIMADYRKRRLLHCVNNIGCITDESKFPPELSREAEAREIAGLFKSHEPVEGLKAHMERLGSNTNLNDAPRRIEGLVNGKWVEMERANGFYADGKIQFPEAWRPVRASCAELTTARKRTAHKATRLTKTTQPAGAMAAGNAARVTLRPASETIRKREREALLASNGTDAH